VTQANDSLFFEIIRSAHGPDPAASRHYRPFDVGPRVTVRPQERRWGNPFAAILRVYAAASAPLARLRVQRAGSGVALAPCCQPAC
jgi:hypothetical protein